MIALIAFTIVGLVYSIRILLEALTVILTLSLLALDAFLGLLKAILVLSRSRPPLTNRNEV